MDSPILRAVIPAAGLGTRLLPLTLSQPKEMLPLGRRPVIEHIAAELQGAGINRVLVITAPRKGSIKGHLVNYSKQSASHRDDPSDKTQFFFKKQNKPMGLGHAVLLSEGFTRGGDFAVALGDSVIEGKEPAGVLKEMMGQHRLLKASAVIAVEEVPEEETFRYGIVNLNGPMPLSGRSAPAAGIIEKPPRGTAQSRLAVAARYVFSGEIFEALRRVKPADKGEMQLTDAINILIKTGRPVYAWLLPTGYKRYDIGNFDSYYRAFIDYSVKDEMSGPSVRKYLKSMAEKL